MERKSEMIKRFIQDTLALFIVIFILFLFGVCYTEEDVQNSQLTVTQDAIDISNPEMAPSAPIEDLDFSDGTFGWTSGSASPYLLSPTFRYDGDNLVINTQRIGEYGWWQNDYVNFSEYWLAPESLLRAQFYVSTDQTNIARVPNIRLFMRNVSAQLNFAYHINSYGPAYASPTQTPKMYEGFFVPHDNSFAPGYGLIYGIETANFNLAEPDSGEIYLSRVVLDRIDSVPLVYSNTYDFQLGAWRYISYPNFSAPKATKTVSQLGLQAINNFDTYGLFQGEGDSVPFEADGNGDPYIYRATFNVSTTLTNFSKVPMFRVSLKQICGREEAILAVASITGSGTAPDQVGKDYYVYIKPPGEEINMAPIGHRILVPTFEMLNVLSDDDPHGTIYLNSAKIDRISESDLPIF